MEKIPLCYTQKKKKTEKENESSEILLKAKTKMVKMFLSTSSH